MLCLDYKHARNQPVRTCEDKMLVQFYFESMYYRLDQWSQFRSLSPSTYIWPRALGGPSYWQPRWWLISTSAVNHRRTPIWSPPPVETSTACTTSSTICNHPRRPTPQPRGSAALFFLGYMLINQLIPNRSVESVEPAQLQCTRNYIIHPSWCWIYKNTTVIFPQLLLYYTTTLLF